MLLPVYVSLFGTVSVYSAMLLPQWYMLCVSIGLALGRNREGVNSAPEVDSRAALLWPGAVLGYVLDMPVVVHVKVVALPRRCAEAVSMVQTVRLTMDIPNCSTRWPMSLLSWSCRFTSSSCAEAVSHGQACLADHRDFAVAVRAGLSMFLLSGSSKSREACS